MRRVSLITAFIFVACSSTNTLNLDVSGIVELDMFSGRPNPVWQLTAAEVSELETRLTDLPEATGVIPQNLGYRGFILGSSSGREIRIYAGSIFFENKVYRDVNDVETWLTAYAARKGVKVRR